jgi:L-ascorbate metabolism protein UlaG (beta-lactamase superfamily)
MTSWLRALFVLAAGTWAGPAVAGCFPLAMAPAGVHLAAFEPLPAGDTLRLTFLGHSSFLIESRGGVSIVTDYNGVHRAPYAPRIVTMNNAHSTHYSNVVEPGVEHVLRGWGLEGGGIAHHDVVVDDVRVRNVPTSVRGRPDALANSNSIFVFEIEDLCVAHLGHLHHPLTDQHLGELGVIDVLLVPVDGMWTMPQDVAVAVIEQVRPAVVVPMHYFGETVLQEFIARLSSEWRVRRHDGPSVTFSRTTLPEREVLVLSGY